jgi:tRNA-specific adenosine deaminase 1
VNASASKRVRIAANDLAFGRECNSSLGILRTKPGRGDCLVTSSMSCSDKISAWNITGLQGALLSHIATPLYLDYLLVGDGYDALACERAFRTRCAGIDMPLALKAKGYRNNSGLLKIAPFESNLKCPVSSSSGEAFYWMHGMSVASCSVSGYRKGSKRPEPGKPYPKILQCSISRSRIFEDLFQHLFDCKGLSYEAVKCLAVSFQAAKRALFEEGAFSSWIVGSQVMKSFREESGFN